MARTVKVRVGVQSAREIEFELADPDAFVADIEKAVAAGDGVVWVTDAKGHRHGIAAEKVAFLEVEGDDSGSGVGFSAVPDA